MFGAQVLAGGTRFSVHAPRAEALLLCLFDEGGERRIATAREGDGWAVTLPGDLAGARYGYRAAGEWAPERGLWFDPAKLLIDPWARALDRRPAHDPRLSQFGVDTAALVAKAIVTAPLPEMPRAAPRFSPGGLIYELHVRGFTRLHPEVPAAQRGTVAALAHPAVIGHLRKLHVSAIELMPIAAWIDERHLPPLGLSNYWGYNPLAPMALDPVLCPGGIAELRETVAALHAEGIGVILDIVFNHSGESDAQGPVIGLRGLDDAAYAHGPGGELRNDTGCGNMLDFARPQVRALALETLRHFVRHAGIDGFRFDLAPVLARGPDFDRAAPFFAELAADRWLADRVLIAEPWDIGPGGYQLGNFPENWLEWNDRYRDDVRRFWRGELGCGVLATRIAGSADIFGEQACRSVNFLCAHDGFTLADLTAYERRHNEANGEDNRDGHEPNFSWNNGAEGPSRDPAILARRAADSRALLGTLFASTGAIMLAAGDEFGRTQHGNNNAYCQDNTLSWLDWANRDSALEDHVAALAAFRAGRLAAFAQFAPASVWERLDGAAMSAADWDAGDGAGFACRAPAWGLRVDRATRVVTLTDAPARR
ncbi:MAG: glycogen debranching protein GlgX [Sphingomonadales bacterium]|nr:glycogen debranching protein GlgX [Sphingomonadales bacterium]